MADYNILIASSNHGLRLLVREELEKSGIYEVKEAESCENTLFEIDKFNPDVVVLGDRFSKGRNINFCSFLRRADPDLKILVLGSSTHELILCEYLKNGANGYILENKMIEELAYAISIIVQGGVWVSPILNEKMIAHVLRKDNHLSLSDKEKTMLKMLSEGKKDTEIAGAMRVSERTVRNHIPQMLEKIGVNTKLQAVAWAVQHGLLE
jgi:DNA-binding NarL/FixJ family response regulator